MATCGDFGGVNAQGKPCGAKATDGPCWRHDDSDGPKNMGGRPSSYQPEYAEQAYQQCLLGATDATLAEFFGVAESTIYEWKKQYPEFCEAIKSGKAPADGNVASALYERATGAEWVEEQAIKVKTVQYEGGKRVIEEERVEVVEVTRRAPPDTTAAIFWLKNRRPDAWRDKQDLEHSGKIQVENLESLTDEELEAIAAGKVPE